MKPVKYHRLAIEEYIEAAKTYTGKSPRAGRTFYEKIKELIREVKRNPATFRRITGSYRRHFQNPFPYAIIYEENPDHIHIVAIAHMHRRPNYWMDRTA